ncbi:DNA topoisomerase IV, alpha subunit [Meredithblackwellia eburnea MCA 4105]
MRIHPSLLRALLSLPSCPIAALRAPVAASQESYADFEQEIGGLSCPPKGGLSEMQQSTTSTPTRQLVFPRKTAGTRPSCNGANLAQLVKTIELVLDGLRGNTFATKRDLYYRSVKTFGRQDRVDYIIEDLAATLQVRREDLNVLAASKGLFAGQISIITVSGKTLSPGSGEDGGGCLVPAAVSIERISCEGARWVLVVEKEAVFQSLCCPAFLKETMGDCPGVLVTGKGYPDVSTRELVKRLSDDYPSVPIFCLVDSDPHGLDILWTYKFGSLSLDFDKENLAVTRIQWLGVRGSEWDSLGVDREELLPLAKADRAKALKMLQRDGLPLEWRRELCYLLHLQRKAEIQVLRVPPNPNTSKLDLIQPKESLVLGEDLFRYVSRKLAEGGV